MRGIQSLFVGLLFVAGGVSGALVSSGSGNGRTLVLTGVLLISFGAYLLWANGREP
jgi:hypothetical protein